MTTALDWEFIREFHPLPPSDRRVLLKSLGVTGVSIIDDAQFYDWLAGFYRDGRAPEIDVVISRKLSKAEERSLLPVLYTWLISCTGTQRRRAHNKVSMIKSMATTVMAMGGADAVRLRALAPNYSWLELPPGDELETPVETGNDGAAPAAAAQLAGSTQGQEPGTGPDAEATLARLLDAAAKLREHPDAALLGLASAFADAVDAQVSTAALATQEAADLQKRQACLALQFGTLDAATAARAGPLPAGLLTRQAIELIEVSLAAVTKAVGAFAAARDGMVAVLDASPEEREQALSVLNASNVARDEAVAALASVVEQSKEGAGSEAFGDFPVMPSLALAVAGSESDLAKPCEQSAVATPVAPNAPSFEGSGGEAGESWAARARISNVEDIVFDGRENERMVLEAIASPDSATRATST